MNDVLYMLCQHDCSIMYDGCPLPATKIAPCLAISLYKARKELKRLKELGYVKSVIKSGFDDYYCQNYILRGYEITEKAKENEEYKKAWENERKICKECFGFDIGASEVE